MVRSPALHTELRVLLVEDDLDVASAIGDYLEAHGLQVDFAYSAMEARARVAGSEFDMLLLDVQLPGETGLQLCQQLKQAGLQTPSLFLTARGGLADRLAGFAAGGIDYIVKPFEPAELLARIRALCGLQRATGRLCVQAAGYRLHPQSGVLERGEHSLVLHAAGVALLERLMQTSPGCVSRQQLMHALWGEQTPASDPLRTHIYELRQAMLAQFGEAPIHTVRGLGYRFAVTP
ncbi:MAG: response regulator transcription factor [Pseudomarimonas sp.]